MTDDNQIKLEVLRYALKNHTQGDTSLNIPMFAQEYGYDQGQVCRVVDDLYPLLEYGVSPRYPWIGYKQQEAVRDRIEKLEQRVEQ